MDVSHLASQLFIQTKGGEMDNKYLFMIVGGVFLSLWYWVGLQPYYASQGIISTWVVAAVLVLALGSGDSEGCPWHETFV